MRTSTTSPKDDFFYVCAVHLKDKNFATAKVDEDALKAKRERELAEETERLKKEYEEKQKKKNEKESKDKEEDTKKAEEEKKKSGGIYGFFERQFKGEPDKPAEEASTPPPPPEDEPRVFELKPAFYQQRIQKKRQVDAAKRDRERVKQPDYFPSVPSDPPVRKHGPAP
ncbi:uncharacterized protein J7T54_000769 [Emericellopsis cladophorae]|uniref:Uncharacterized protein n=1 Tax=Emericellopsis cladophorae TaxID=2686198 RepID=A0A9P9XVX2_9HYPO|nr:uncharacterized protein J7T54_000769 [Emericellopsis cladophorae]KAI6778735.1 hypothetical protein J7T54_000769 [Emericellopsis cladophorae]